MQTSIVLDHLFVKLATSVGRALEWKSEGHGFESHMRLTLYLESKNFNTTLSIIYLSICIYYHLSIYLSIYYYVQVCFWYQCCLALGAAMLGDKNFFKVLARYCQNLNMCTFQDYDFGQRFSLELILFLLSLLLLLFLSLLGRSLLLFSLLLLLFFFFFLLLF